MHQDVESEMIVPADFDDLDAVAEQAAQKIIDMMGERFSGLAVIVTDKDKRYSTMHCDGGGCVVPILYHLAGQIKEENGTDEIKH